MAGNAYSQNGISINFIDTSIACTLDICINE